MSHVRVLLLDIEGTTTPIDFVHKLLFPYARARMAEYLSARFEAVDRALLTAEYDADSDISKPAWQDPPLNYLLWLMDHDRKSRGLKNIQGKIWERGYHDGSIRSEIYPDVAPALRRWRDMGKRIFIYSSGSVQAQQLLFGHTCEGDLTPLIDAYFDTQVGPKRDRASYETIAAHLGVQPSQCLFVSDIAAELVAATDAGFNVLLSVRPGNDPQPGNFPVLKTFDDLFDRIGITSERR